MHLEIKIKEYPDWLDMYDLVSLDTIVDSDTVTITDSEHDLGLELEGKHRVYDLIQFARRLVTVAKNGYEEEFDALLEYLDFGEAYQTLIDGKYGYFPDVHNEYELGEYLVDEGYFGEVSDCLKAFIDYKAIGREKNIVHEGGFTENGGFIIIY